MRKLTWFLLFMMLFVSNVQADQNDLNNMRQTDSNEWVMIKDDKRHNITTWARQEEGKRTRSFKVVAVMDGSLEDYIRMLYDFDSYKRWYFEVIESKLLKQISPTEYLIYIVHNAPPGTPDRDAILHIEFELPSAAKPYLLARQTSMPDYMPIQPPYVRVISEDILLKFYRLTNNRVKVEAQGFVDPAGNDPAWVVNFFQRSAPYKSFLSISRRLKQISGESQKSPLPFSLDQIREVAE